MIASLYRSVSMVSGGFQRISPYMPALLGINSFATSMFRLVFWNPQEQSLIAHHRAQQTPLPNRLQSRLRPAAPVSGFSTPPPPPTIDPTDLERDFAAVDRQKKYERIADGCNICGVAAFLYFSAPWGLAIGYLFWSGHYISRTVTQLSEPDLNPSDWGWAALNTFGAITCITCAIFAHGAIPITAGIAAAQVTASTLSTIETGVFFITVMHKSADVAIKGGRRVVEAMTPARRSPVSRRMDSTGSPNLPRRHNGRRLKPIPFNLDETAVGAPEVLDERISEGPLRGILLRKGQSRKPHAVGVNFESPI